MVFDVWGVLQVPSQSPQFKDFQNETLSVIYATVTRMTIRHTFSRVRCTRSERAQRGGRPKAPEFVAGRLSVVAATGPSALTFKP